MSLKEDVIGLEKELQDTQNSIQSLNSKIKENEVKLIEIKKLKEAKEKISSQLKALQDREVQTKSQIKEQEELIAKEIDSLEEE